MICWIMEKAREFQKNIYFCFIEYAKANRKPKKAGVAILISYKIDLKIKITSEKQGHYIMIKGSGRWRKRRRSGLGRGDERVAEVACARKCR